MSEQKDEQILKYFREGKQQEAFKLLMNTYQHRMYWQIRRILISHDDTDDVLQNTLIKIWKGLPAFNETFTYLEKNKKQLSNVDIEECYLFAGSTDDHIDGEYIQQKLEQAILLIPEKQRMVFHLKYFEDMKYTEISEVLGTSVGALKANYHLAVKKIEDFLSTD